jgi:membrane protease YdiL (CAAX protease family)
VPEGVESTQESSLGIVALVKRAIVALAITLVPQGVWSALIVTNLRTLPSIPWSVLVMAVILGIGAQYLRGAWGPARTAASRRHSLRATVVSRKMFMWAWLAGGLSMIALVGVWILLASSVRMPGSVLPDLSGYPRWTAILAVGMGALISPLCEQAGIWGYWQGALERRWSGATAIMVTSVAFALGPHPPAGAPIVARVTFFFLTGLIFSTMTYLTNSILPAIPVHVVGLLMFFVLVWPVDPERRLVPTSGTDAWFWIHVAQVAAFAVFACWAFGRLAELHRRRGETRFPR